MSKVTFAFAALAAVAAVAAQPPSAPAVDPAIIAFGYTDKAGTKLLALGEMDDAFANTLATAVCPEGLILPIRFQRMQQQSPASNGRQSDGNFANEGGALFEVVAGHAEADDTCMLVPPEYLAAFPVARNEFPKSERAAGNSAYWRASAAGSDVNQPVEVFQFHAPSAFARSSIGALQAAKSRSVKLYWPLHRSGTAQEVAAIEFTPDGDSLLGSLVLMNSGRLSFMDWPASLKKGLKDGGCWRVEDECRFGMVGMEVPAVLGHPGRQLIFFTFYGAEGQLIKLLQVEDGALVELKGAYRYHAAL